ncbi:hypothetical protein LTS08_007866 [Lithohypha guttulata]|nr:hypothetical protein LTS08_007866 [Lithohypha guttulata]
MGFFDFIGKAVGAVKNLVQQNPIVKEIANITGVVAHAVPGLGPAIDVAVPAMQAIFSDNSPSPSAPSNPLDQPANIINLRKTE